MQRISGGAHAAVRTPRPSHDASATHDDFRDVVGNLDDDRMEAILASKPTIRELEEASLWLSGDMDVSGPGRPLKDFQAQSSLC